MEGELVRGGLRLSGQHVVFPSLIKLVAFHTEERYARGPQKRETKKDQGESNAVYLKHTDGRTSTGMKEQVTHCVEAGRDRGKVMEQTTQRISRNEQEQSRRLKSNVIR